MLNNLFQQNKLIQNINVYLHYLGSRNHRISTGNKNIRKIYIFIVWQASPIVISRNGIIKVLI
jgi:hypothetical protein